MRCCPKCFSDPVAQDIVRELAHGDIGACDFCGTTDVPVADVSPECELFGYFDEMLDVFASAHQTTESQRLTDPMSLEEAFVSLWKVFSIDARLVREFLNALFCEETWYTELVSAPVVVTPNRGKGSVSDYSIFGKQTWGDFVDSIKNNLRFHTRIEHEELFVGVCNALSRSLLPEQSWYRARVWNKRERPKERDLHEAPANVTRNGRMNVAGIPCLYIADSPITAISETRASRFDTMAVAHMHPTGIMSIVDLSRIHNVSPFDEIDCNVLAANIENLKLIRQELLKPMRQTDPELDYLPTEYISDLIKSLGYDGIGYKSVMNEKGYNVASFRTVEESFAIQDIDLYHIGGINYVLECKP